MPELSGAAVKSYRYLRLAMVALVVMLFASVAFEWAQTSFECMQTSISAYYYTPVKAVFVGVLVSIGVCMVALKGNTDREDILLNLAGMLAPVVAFVPTPGAGGCRSVPLARRDASADIENNMVALFVAGLVGLVVAVVLALRSRWGSWDRDHLFGLLLAAGTFAGGIVWFVVDREGFEGAAHYAAALPLFVCILGVALLNALQFREKSSAASGQARGYANRYSVVAVLMVVSAVGMGLWTWLGDWDHGVLWIEGTLITLFAYFWLVQTHELWDEGLRS